MSTTIRKDITLSIDLDQKNFPKSITWKADDAGTPQEIPAHAMILSLWDPKAKGSMRLDLWTDKMTVDEMKIFFHETLVTMADTLQRSIADERIAGDMRDFCDYFAEKMEIKQAE